MEPTKLHQRERGRLLVLDGASGVGKSTLALTLLADPELDLRFVRRYTTRLPRPNDSEEGNYHFVSPETFGRFVRRGELAEYRHFEFGMSYGLPKREVSRILTQGHNALAIINLGNIVQVRKHYPDSIAILITASQETIERRLRARGLEEEKIQERLANARLAARLAHLYDTVLDTDSVGVEEATARLKSFLVKCLRST